MELNSLHSLVVWEIGQEQRILQGGTSANKDGAGIARSLNRSRPIERKFIMRRLRTGHINIRKQHLEPVENPRTSRAASVSIERLGWVANWLAERIDRLIAAE